MRYENITATLTSDASGDATVTTQVVSGKIVKISTIGVVAPNANWDFDIQSKNLGVWATEFTDDTRSNSTTVADVDYPAVAEVKNTDGSSSSTYKSGIYINGPLKFIGANMGASKSAKVSILVEVA